MYKIKINRKRHTIKVTRVIRRVVIHGKSKRGLPGVGVPIGGTTGQILAKKSNAPHDTEWKDDEGGFVISVNGETGVVELDKTHIGLPNVDNTSDANKPVSTLQAAAIAVVQSDVNTHEARTDNPHSVTKAQVGLGSVDNTSDANKPISTATQTALNAKANDNAVVHNTGNETIAGEKTFEEATFFDDNVDIGGSFGAAQGGTFSGNVNMNGNKVVDIDTPTAGNDAANKIYVDAAVADVPLGDYVLKTGDTMLGELNMNSNVLSNLPNGVDDNDAVNMLQLAAKQDLLGYPAENADNRDTNTSLGTSDTLYPSQNAVKVYIDGVVGDKQDKNKTVLVDSADYEVEEDDTLVVVATADFSVTFAQATAADINREVLVTNLMGAPITIFKGVTDIEIPESSYLHMYVIETGFVGSGNFEWVDTAPVSNVSITNLVPYTGATSDVDISGHTMTADNYFGTPYADNYWMAPGDTEVYIGAGLGNENPGGNVYINAGDGNDDGSIDSGNVTLRVGSNSTAGTVGDVVLVSPNSGYGATFDFSQSSGMYTILLPNQHIDLNDVSLINQKADDNAVVHLTNDESIDGIKTFLLSPIVPTPLNNTEIANKLYVDTAVSGVPIGNYVLKAGDTMTGALVNTLATGNSLVWDTNTLVVDATNHRVGIGVTTPAAPLHIKMGATASSLGATVSGRGIALSGTGSNARLYFESTDGTTGARVYSIYNTGGNLRISSLSDTGASFVTDPIVQFSANGFVSFTGSTSAVTSTLSGNETVAGYLRVGSNTAPANTTAGDLTVVRLNVGSNAAFSATNGWVARIIGTVTETSGLSYGAFVQITAAPTALSTTEVRALNMSVITSGTNGQGTLAGGYFETRVNSNAAIASARGVQGYGAVVIDAAFASTITNSIGIFAQAYNVANNPGGTITTATGVRAVNPPAVGSGGLVISTLIGMDIDAQTRGVTNSIGMRIAAPSGATNNYALQLSDTAGGTSGGITFGTDVQLYRSGANTLQSGALIKSIRVNVTDRAFGATITGDSVDRFGIACDGKIEWGSGSATRDTNLYRNSADVLKTDDALVVARSFVAGNATLTDASTVATDASLGNHFRVTLGGNRTLGNPTNPVDGQKVTWELIQDATGSRTITLDTKFALGTDIAAVTLTTAANKRDFLGAVYNSTADKWFVVAFVKGY